jgi:hypothetical protein
MSVTCPHCQQTAQDSDTFCFSCGSRLKRRTIVVDDDYFPVPGVVGQPDLRILKKRRRNRRPVVSKPFIAAVAIIAMILIIGSASAMLQI